MLKKILFIDRDGTLIHEPCDNLQVDKVSKLIFEPFVIVVLKKLIEFGFTLVMVSNQDGLYTTNFSYSSFIKPHKLMVDILYSQGIIFEYILICPHYIEDNCDCRKPNIGLVMPWIVNNDFDKENSYFIGDRLTDIELANKMGIQGILYNANGMNWNNIQDLVCNKVRFAQIIRKSKETNINIKLWLDQSGENIINTGISFLNHMIEQIAIHANILIHMYVSGDIHVDDHHTIEDTGIVLGQVILQCLGDKLGINRFGFYVPMDESASYCLLDLSGRAYLKFIGIFKHQFVGDFSTDMVEHFFRSLAFSMNSTIHLVSVGLNDHHKIESLFKAFGRSLKQAIYRKGNILPTSKGIL